MKSSSKIIFILSLVVVGIAVGLQIREPYQMSGYGSIFNRELISKINKERIEIYDLEKQIRSKKKEIENINELASFTNEDIAIYKERMNHLKKAMGDSNLQGSGILMTIDGYEDYNIAYLMEDKKFLILLVNELKSHQAEAISINGQRVTPFSEITLAGNHININFKAIAQPYEIRAIGDGARLFEYMNSKSPVVDIMRKGYALKIGLKYEEQLTIKSLEKRKIMEKIEPKDV